MFITRQSQITGKIHTLDLPITQKQLDDFNNGAILQDVFSNLTPGQREFIYSGITEEEWDEMLQEPEEE
jgi:hypothetical protein